MVGKVELTSNVILKVEDIGLFASLVFLIACLMYQLHIVMCLATHHDVFLREKRLISETTQIRRSFMGYQVTWRNDPISQRGAFSQVFQMLWSLQVQSQMRYANQFVMISFWKTTQGPTSPI